MRLYLLLFFMVCGLAGSATHNRAGEITYRHLFGNTYEATVTTCTKTSAPADRPELTDFSWGDGDVDTLTRDQTIFFPTWDAQKNIYHGTHTYAGSGTYEMSMFDPNRNSNILNIKNSVGQPFCLKSTLKFSPILGHNNSVILNECPCPEVACAFQPYCYNVGASDPDNDSLSFQLIAPYGNTSCTQLAIPTQYVFPDNPIVVPNEPSGGGGTITMDPQTGTMCWDAPQVQGEFNIAIEITEWRAGIMVGRVIRDIQITVVGNCNNTPPEIDPLTDYCVEAGDTIDFDVVASDPDGDNIDLSAFGQPLNENTSPAQWSNTVLVPPVEGNFYWETVCDHVSGAPYMMNFIAEDDAQDVPLSDVETVFITVNAPAPENLLVAPVSNDMQLSWSPATCPNVIGYNVYRRIGTSTYSENCCSQSAAEAMGYSFIGNTSGLNDTTFLDTDPALVIGATYCYIVTAVYPGNVESCVSDQVCAQLLMDVPVITNVTVSQTDASNGMDTVIWAMPKELDTTQFQGPYEYRVYRRDNFTSPNVLVHTTPSSPFLATTDTIYQDPSINTEDNPHVYKIELYHTNTSGNMEIVGSTNAASSIYLSATGSDNKITLSWQENVPWNNTLYEVYRESSPGTFTLIGTTPDQLYEDNNLLNGVEYCYKVKSVGTYGTQGIIDPLINWSQELCAKPVDQTPPCPPTLAVDSSCEDIMNELIWNNPNNTCADDVMSYTLYYTDSLGGEFEPIAYFSSNQDTTYTHYNQELESIAGCYYVTATDSVQYGNESDSSNVVCVDNCPYYWLPNIITPNNDGKNDMFRPFPYRFVKSVNCEIYNRWGGLVYETTNPDILWDATNMDTGEPVSEGVYYYRVIVYTIRLSGIDPIELKGFFHVVRGPQYTGQ